MNQLFAAMEPIMARSDGAAPLQPSEGTACYRAKALEAIQGWVSSRNLTLYARNYIAEALKGPDEARASRGRMKGRFPSSRMGVSLAIEHGWLRWAEGKNRPHCEQVEIAQHGIHLSPR